MRGESFRSTGNHFTTSLYETLREEILEAERRVVVQFQQHHPHSKCYFLYLSCLLGTYGSTHKMSPLVNANTLQNPSHMLPDSPELGKKSVGS